MTSAPVAYDIEVFYQLCEVAIGIHSSSNSPSTKLAPATTNNKATNAKWENIRRWFSDHPEIEERHTACVQQGMNNTTPLHLLCQHKLVPFDIIEEVIESAPEVGSWDDANGWIPLHYACAKGVSLDVLRALVLIYPEGLRARDHRLRTPLHFTFYKSEVERGGGDDEDDDYHNPYESDGGYYSMNMSGSEDMNDSITSNDVVEMVLLLKTAVKIPDEKKRLPIHFAAAYGSPVTAVEALVEYFPESVNAKEESGRTPLHYVMSNAHNKSSPSILEFLLSKMEEEDINAGDNNGNLPLQLLCIRAKSIDFNGAVGEENNAQRNATKCLKLYLSAKPKSSADFLTTLQSLPEWLRDDAVTHSHVKDILNRKISNRFPTSILMLDGYFYILIISCFSHASQAHIKYCFQAEKELPPNIHTTITACFVGASYFLNREVSQIISTISLGTFRSWILNAENWLDIGVVVLLFNYCLVMQSRERDLQIMQDFGSAQDESFRIGAALTVAALWAATVSYLKNTMLEFSLFFETVLYVTRKIFVYLIVLVVILVAFAEMFLIVFRKTPVCTQQCAAEGEWVFPHCTFKDSVLKVYTMMLGEVGDVNRYQQKLISQILYLIFVFLVVILLSNVLIAMVTESHSIIKNERAEMVFWSNRLDFVAEMDSIVVIKRYLVRKVSCCSQPNDYSRASNDYDQDGSGGSRISNREPFRRLWGNMIACLWHESISDDNVFLEICLYSILRVAIVTFFIPVWICLGIVSAGWLFPPQVREWIFVMNENRYSARTKTINVDDEICTLKKEVKESRAMMAAELFAAREDCLSLRQEMTDVQSSIKMEIAAVKDMTDALLQAYTRQRVT
mmetsp:Transcript_25844/g.38708  ORF Transcript_25844/g.38708 Transcript_25844/m.38708 type:complete len:849 (+) Transcript_25844:34-2580(+)